MSIPISALFFKVFRSEPVRSRDIVEAKNAREETHERVERAALYARHGYFHLSYTPLLYPFVPEIPLE